MFCGKCGFELEDGSLFCGNCGAPVPGGKAAPHAGQGAMGTPAGTPPVSIPDDAADAAAAIGSLDATDDFDKRASSSPAETVVIEQPYYRQGPSQQPTQQIDPSYLKPAAAAPAGSTPPDNGNRNKKIIAIASAVAAAAVAFALGWFLTHGGMDIFNGGQSGGQNAVAQSETTQDTATGSDGSTGTSPSKEASTSKEGSSSANNGGSSASSSKNESKSESSTAPKADDSTSMKTDSKPSDSSSSKADSPSSKTESKTDSKTDSQSSGGQSKNQASPASTDYILADTNSRYYSESELKKMTARDLYVARNEIYARHGRGFKNDDLQSYFDAKSWYTKRYEPDEFDKLANPLNDYEQKNADLMLKVETDMKSPYLAKENRPAI